MNDPRQTNELQLLNESEQAGEAREAADKTDQFGTENVVRLLIRYSLPSIVAMIVQSTYNTINMSFVGQKVGPIGIAAIAVCMPITMIQGAINSLIGNGCSAGVAIKLGEGDREGGRKLLGSAVTFNLIVATINVVLGHIFIDQLLRAFGATDTILPYARDYLNITMFAMVFSSFGPLNPMMRIEGYPRRAMMTQLLSTAVNLVCSPTFIFVFDLGIRGAALGTFCAQFAASSWIFFFLIRKERIIGLKRKYLRLKIGSLLHVMQLGLPNFLMSLSQSLLSVNLNKSLITYGGDISVSAWGITNNINNLIQQPVFGFNQGAQPIIGYNIGAKNYARVKQALLCSLGIAFFFSSLGWLLTRLFASQIFAFFNSDPELIAVGTRMMIIFRAFIFVVGFQQMGAAYFQFSGKPKISIVLTLSRQVLILLPCILILSRYFGMNGILYSGPIADFTSTTLVFIFIIREYKRLNRLQREQEAEAQAGPLETT